MPRTSKLPTPAAMAELLLATISAKDEVEWSEILAAVSARFTVKNWLTQVRGPLQGLKNQGKVIRTADIFHERYCVVR